MEDKNGHNSPEAIKWAAIERIVTKIAIAAVLIALEVSVCFAPYVIF